MVVSFVLCPDGRLPGARALPVPRAGCARAVPRDAVAVPSSGRRTGRAAQDEPDGAGPASGRTATGAARRRRGAWTGFGSSCCASFLFRRAADRSAAGDRAATPSGRVASAERTGLDARTRGHDGPRLVPLAGDVRAAREQGHE